MLTNWPIWLAKAFTKNQPRSWETVCISCKERAVINTTGKYHFYTLHKADTAVIHILSIWGENFIAHIDTSIFLHHSIWHWCKTFLWRIKDVFLFLFFPHFAFAFVNNSGNHLYKHKRNFVHKHQDTKYPKIFMSSILFIENDFLSFFFFFFFFFFFPKYIYIYIYYFFYTPPPFQILIQNIQAQKKEETKT